MMPLVHVLFELIIPTASLLSAQIAYTSSYLGINATFYTLIHLLLLRKAIILSDRKELGFAFGSLVKWLS